MAPPELNQQPNQEKPKLDLAELQRQMEELKAKVAEAQEEEKRKTTEAKEQAIGEKVGEMESVYDEGKKVSSELEETNQKVATAERVLEEFAQVAEQAKAAGMDVSSQYEAFNKALEDEKSRLAELQTRQSELMAKVQELAGNTEVMGRIQEQAVKENIERNPEEPKSESVEAIPTTEVAQETILPETEKEKGLDSVDKKYAPEWKAVKQETDRLEKSKLDRESMTPEQIVKNLESLGGMDRAISSLCDISPEELQKLAQNNTFKDFLYGRVFKELYAGLSNEEDDYTAEKIKIIRLFELVNIDLLALAKVNNVKQETLARSEESRITTFTSFIDSYRNVARGFGEIVKAGEINDKIIGLVSASHNALTGALKSSADRPAILNLFAKHFDYFQKKGDHSSIRNVLENVAVAVHKGAINAEEAKTILGYEFPTSEPKE